MDFKIRLTTAKPLIFTLSEANACVALIRKWTVESQKQIEQLSRKKSDLKENNRLNELIDVQIREIFATWQKRVQQLGAIPKGLWTVDFDHGRGLFCWRFPETQISFHHEYGHGGSGRRRISENLNEDKSLCESL
jgi:hypothetical protein